MHEAGNPLGIIQKPSDYATLPAADRCEKQYVTPATDSAWPGNTAAAAGVENSPAGETQIVAVTSGRQMLAGTAAAASDTGSGSKFVDALVGTERIDRFASGAQIDSSMSATS